MALVRTCAIAPIFTVMTSASLQAIMTNVRLSIAQSQSAAVVLANCLEAAGEMTVLPDP